jgi:hypothetical protein
MIFVPAESGSAATVEMVTIDPHDLTGAGPKPWRLVFQTVRRERSSERLRFKPQLDLCNCRQGLWAWSQRILRARCRRFLTYDPRMSESHWAKAYGAFFGVS